MLGDYSPHNIWATTPEDVKESNEAVTTILKEKLGPTGIDIFPVLGNHDLYPPTLQDFSHGPYYNELSHLHGLWEDTHWLNEEQANRFAEYGFYSKQLRHDPNSKVLVLNNNACYSMNPLVAKDFADPGGQLEWLQNELQGLEDVGGSAYIISHVPGIDCIRQYGERLDMLIRRYQNTIRFASYGHRHRENFYIS